MKGCRHGQRIEALHGRAHPRLPSHGGQVNPDPEAWGVGPGYWDVAGNWRPVPPETLETVLDAMGAQGPAPAGDPAFVTVGERGPWPGLPDGTLALEAGGSVQLGLDGGPELLPVGYHRLDCPDGRRLTVAVCPERCPAPPPGRTWGWSAQLYATRSRSSWGIGDFADLRNLVGWAGANGAGFVLLNPLHAPAPGAVPEPSPYFPSSRCFLNPLYISVEEVPAAQDEPAVAALGDKARCLNAERLIDRTAVWACKSEALEVLFERFEQDGRRAAGSDEFEVYLAQRGDLLDRYTSFCAISEVHGLPWSDWPQELRRPGNAAVSEFAGSEAGSKRKRFHAWLQWLSERQLAQASDVNGAGIMCDLAVGADGGGADAWIWQDTFALGMRVGAPPDEYSVEGQDWGLPPWDPWKLRAAGYEPYIEMLRAVLRPARGMRVDHVMGLFRMFWVPVGAQPSRGAFVRSIWEDMVGILKLEAHRAGAYIVGEDLGTVEDHVREVLGRGGVLSYKIYWFEPQPPEAWPYQAMGAVTTHDLPTVAGAWTGSDIEAQRSFGLPFNEEGCAAMRRRLQDWAGLGEASTLADVVAATYASLASAPCALLAAALDDVLMVEERPNMPGTIDQWPNWCLALPAPLEEIEASPVAEAVMRRFNA